MKPRTQLAEWDRRYLWHPFTQMRDWERELPVIIQRGKGPYLFDVDGRRYLDGVSSLWVNVHGHRHPQLDRAIREQLTQIAHSTLLGLSNPPAIRLARQLIRLAPRGLTRLFYSDDGSTAVEVALKMAVQYWQQRAPKAGPKRTFLRLQLAYHGDTVGAMSVGGMELFQGRFRSLLFPTLAAEPPYCYRCPLGLTYPSCSMACLDPIERLLKRRHRDLAGFIIEPLVQGAAGMLTHPPGYLREVRELCDRHGTLLVLDEVATGFGRTGTMFACEQERVSPDLLCLGKGLTGGYMPLAATLASERIHDGFLGAHEEFRTFFHGHTFSGNPLACAAALASLEAFRSERTLLRLQPKIRLLNELLEGIEAMPEVAEVRGRGMMIGIDLGEHDPALRLGHRVTLEARQRGAIIRPLGDVVVLMPPLSISKADLRRLLEITSESIHAAHASAYGPARATQALAQAA